MHLMHLRRDGGGQTVMLHLDGILNVQCVGQAIQVIEEEAARHAIIHLIIDLSEITEVAVSLADCKQQLLQAAQGDSGLSVRVDFVVPVNNAGRKTLGHLLCSESNVRSMIYGTLEELLHDSNICSR